MPAIEYLEAYSRELDSVHTVHRLYGHILNWQRDQNALGVEAQKEINHTFFRNPKGVTLRLRHENPPTTSVGGFNGIVAIAANPGYDETANAHEIAFREAPEGNRNFCESFFGEAGHLTKKMRWWKPMAHFCRAALLGEGDGPLALDALWSWAAASGCIGSVDLVPFHSQGDGVTRLIETKPSLHTDSANLKRALRNAGKSTFQMVLRLQPRVVFVASAAGAQIAEEVLSEDPAVESHNLLRSTQLSVWGHQLSYQLRRHRVGNTHIITMPLQLSLGERDPSESFRVQLHKPSKTYCEQIDGSDGGQSKPVAMKSSTLRRMNSRSLPNFRRPCSLWVPNAAPSSDMWKLFTYSVTGNS